MIATYNQPEYIVKAVQSCLNQDYDNFEIVVGDDSTNDDVYNALLQFQNNPKFKYFRNKENIGRVKNYRKLLYEYATGDWAVMLDGDDYYIDNTYLSAAAKWINNKQEVVLVCAGHSIVNENDNTETPLPLTTENIMHTGKDLFIKFLQVGQHSTCVYNRKRAIAINFYSVDSLGADTESLLRLILFGNVAFLKNIVVAWRIHSGNKTYNQNEALQQMHELKYIDTVFSYATNFIGLEKAIIWKHKMYSSMSYHIAGLAEKSKRKLTIFRVALWASKYWGFTGTLRYMKRTLLF
jgi:glycosyltransferase involved in cell wall biosynthesis